MCLHSDVPAARSSPLESHFQAVLRPPRCWDEWMTAEALSSSFSVSSSPSHGVSSGPSHGVSSGPSQSVLQPSESPSALHSVLHPFTQSLHRPFTQSLLRPFTVSSNPSHRVSISPSHRVSFSPSHGVSASPSHGVSSGPSHRVSSSPSHGESFSLSHRASCTQNTPNPWVLNWMPWEIQPGMGLEGKSCPFSVSYAESTSTVKFLILPKVSRRKTKRGLLWRSSRLEKTMKFSS